MTSDDLTSLYQQADDAPAPMSLRQGVVQAWDSDTGANTITVGGGVLENVPVLVGETVSVAVGDVVALLTTGDRWFLLGKVTDPGDPGTVPTWTTDITALTTTVDTVTTVTIPAIQNDVTVTQGQVTELGDVTIPAVQADADAAQAAADTAQTTATGAATDAAAAQSTADAAAADAAAAQAHFPITETDISDGAISTPKLAADAIDGMTITGALIRTAATGRRIEIDSPTSASEIRAYTDSVDEVAPGQIQVTDSELGLTSPDRGAGASFVEIRGDASSNQVYATADDGIFLRGDGAAHANQIWVSAADGAVMSAAGNTNQIFADADGATMHTASGPDPISLTSGAGGIALASTGPVTLNGARVAILPQCLSAACTANVDLANSVEVDVTGATVTFTTVRPNAKFICTGSFYFAMIAASNGVALGKLSVDGTVQSAFANFTGLFSTPERVNASQTWVGTLAAAGSHTLKLRGVGPGVSGTPTTAAHRINATSTTISVLVFE